MKKEIKQITIGLLILLASVAVVFYALYWYMDRQTESDVRHIAGVFLEDKAKQEENRFEAVKSLRFSQMDTMKAELSALGDDPTAEEINDTLVRMADLQNLYNCSLVSESHTIETVYGEPIQRLGDEPFLIKSLEEDKKMVVTGGWGASRQMIIYAAPASVPMRNGETSIGFLVCMPMSTFSSMMNLEDPESLVYYHIIRRDASFVIDSKKLPTGNFDEIVMNHVIPNDMSTEDCLQNLHQSIENNEIFTADIRYVDKDKGVDDRRSVYAMPLKESNWYLLSIIPYGVLDETITGMGQTRFNGMLLALITLTGVMLVIFYLYMHMTKGQMHKLEASKVFAESARAESEKAREEAVKAQEESEKAREEAVKAQEESEKAREEAVKAQEESEKAREEAVKAQEESEKAREEAVKAQEESEKAREEAVEASKAKSEFLSNMSHDIRTPMNAIVGMTVIASDHIDDKERVKDCLKKITLSSRHLLGLINDVLDMSKIESGKMTLSLEPLSLKQTMETMCDIVRSQIKDKHQNFDIVTGSIIAEEVYCDSVRLNQVMLNFLSNAIKFTQQGGTIRLGMWQEASPQGEAYVRTHLSVSDNGMGMTEEFRGKLFNAFEREDNRRVHKTQGTGLGMAITKYIVDAMGGTIEVESEVGKGSTFHVIIDFEKVSVDEADMKLPDWKILVVDDSESMCAAAVLSLTELGTRPQSCCSGEEAVQRVIEEEKTGEGFFAVLIDYKLGGISGVEAARQIHEKIGDKVPVSLISAYDWSDIEAEAEAAGIHGFISKPLFKSTLYHELKKYLDEDTTASDASTERSEIDITGLHILLAEDNELNAEIATMILEESGCIVEYAEDGKIACEMFEKSDQGYYNAILMDLRMPNMNGIEAAETIRKMKRPDAGKIPIIAMTADAFAEDAKRCHEAGMNAHLAKPIDVEQLKYTLAHMVSR